MTQERPDLETTRIEEQERSRRKEALQILMDSRERLLSQMADEIQSHRDLILDGTLGGESFGFELQEIEDRYTARLNALNTLLENLEYRRPRLIHRLETISTTVGSLHKDVSEFLKDCGEWEVASLSTLQLEHDRALVLVVLTAEEYPEG